MTGNDSSTLTPATEVQTPPARRFSSKFATLAIALSASALSAFRSNRPLFDGDELNYFYAATRSTSGLWHLLGKNDAYHGFYDFFLHFWYAVFPATEFWGRLPSAIAVGFAAAGVVILGEKLSTSTVAVASGIIFAILPRVTLAGSTLREYGVAMALAVWLTILCVVAAQRGDDRRWWAGYGLAFALAVAMNLYTVLIVPAHVVAVMAYGTNPRAMRSWGVVTGGALALIAPLLLLSQRQFPPSTVFGRFNSETLGQVLESQYFDGPPVTVGILSGIILLAGLFHALRSGARRPNAFVSLLLAWTVVPTVILLLLSFFRPAYVPRYLSFTTPGFALLLGLCLASVVRSKVAIAAILIIFAASASPNYFAQRVEKNRGYQRYSEFAEIIDQNAEPGDCVVFNESDKAWPPLRRMTNYRPESFKKLNDPALVDWDTLYPNLMPFPRYADRLNECTVVWSVSPRDWPMPAGHTSAADPAGHPPAALPPGSVWEATPSYRKLSELGFRTSDRWQFGGAQLTKSVRWSRTPG